MGKAGRSEGEGGRGWKVREKGRREAEGERKDQDS